MSSYGKIYIDESALDDFEKQHGELDPTWHTYKFDLEVWEMLRTRKDNTQLVLPIGATNDISNESANTNHFHSYQEYRGLIENYKFCVHCDKKEPLDD